MDFRNHTPFPALAFEGIDQFDRAFHVFVLRQTLTWGADGLLVYAEEQEPLCEVDEYFGALNESSVRQESDLCHYKPKCDVIVNAMAHAPAGTSPQRFDVRLVLSRPDTAATLPPRPQGLNQFVEPDTAALVKWQEAVAHAQQHPVQGRRLIDKTLTVTGERELLRTAWPIRVLASVAQACTLGLFKPRVWRLTAPQPFSSVPLRYEYAFGGECRIRHNEPGAKRLHDKERIPVSARAANDAVVAPDPQAPAALEAFESNAVGRGYAAPWFLRAARVERIPAPRIEPAGQPFTAAKFCMMQKTENHGPEAVSAILAGFGVRTKGHPQRRALCGTIDQRFVEGNAWLPEDFDFGVWNAAPPDQQTDFLQGDEYVELTNLCAPGSAGSGSRGGDTVVRLQLPGHSCTLLVRMKNGTMFFHTMKIDTVIIEPDGRKVSVVWRAVLEKTPEIRAVDVNLHKQFEADFTRHLDKELDNMAVEDLLASLTVPLEDHHG
ncbi:DUF2169 family type VI secretion system accessory protein [Pseudoduganella buxea]|uniref:DUF2169 domain-containing protein n=1 Tax=Pseudoduganella buxea TaxID=1949069 RepID=A0ABQ1KY63_9BURK|nr:DUF2169 domain-containing protein [Pseudoduganella buxea]GGC13110.1 hypothetical protein GCM10011572_38130 [Pseudoduganella buxea]